MCIFMISNLLVREARIDQLLFLDVDEFLEQRLRTFADEISIMKKYNVAIFPFLR